jgi:hypothetical protein
MISRASRKYDLRPMRTSTIDEQSTNCAGEHLKRDTRVPLPLLHPLTCSHGVPLFRASIYPDVIKAEVK